jgi:hypothetical protein
MLLLTLNRLHGEDDPRLRGLLLEHLHHDMSLDDLVDLLPDDREEIRALIRIAHPPNPCEPVLPALPIEDMPQAITFFFTEPHLARLKVRLREFDSDRSLALIKALSLGQPPSDAIDEPPSALD